jgi:hypothetical protein
LIANKTKKAAHAAFFVSGKSQQGSGVYKLTMSIPRLLEETDTSLWVAERRWDKAKTDEEAECTSST